MRSTSEKSTNTMGENTIQGVRVQGCVLRINKTRSKRRLIYSYRSDERLKTKNQESTGLFVIHRTARGTGTPKDRDEVKKLHLYSISFLLFIINR